MTREMMAALAELSRASLVSGRVPQAIATRLAMEYADAAARIRMPEESDEAAMAWVDVLASVHRSS